MCIKWVAARGIHNAAAMFHSTQPPPGLPALEIDLELMRRFDLCAAAYPSYPSADRFTESFNGDAYKGWLARRNVGGIRRPLALHIHLPWGAGFCFYCGGYKGVTRNRTRALNCLKYLGEEIALQSGALNGDNRVKYMHWASADAHVLTVERCRELNERLRDHFDFDRDGIYSVQVDAPAEDQAYLDVLRECGFNCLNVGVQGFDKNTSMEVRAGRTIEAARLRGFKSINVDLVYGVTGQPLTHTERMLDDIIATAPECIGLHNYLEIGGQWLPRRRIGEPRARTRDANLTSWAACVHRLNAAGYRHIGLEHFARAGAMPALPQRSRLLQGRFAAQSTFAECDLLGLGVGAISNVGPTYSQNFRSLDDYGNSLRDGALPIMRGIELSADDLLRRSVIGALTANFMLTKQALAIAYLIEFDSYFEVELNELRELEQLGLVELDDYEVRITPKGRPLVRNICAVFDRYLRRDRERRRHPREI